MHWGRGLALSNFKTAGSSSAANSILCFSLAAALAKFATAVASKTLAPENQPAGASGSFSWSAASAGRIRQRYGRLSISSTLASSSVPKSSGLNSASRATAGSSSSCSWSEGMLVAHFRSHSRSSCWSCPLWPWRRYWVPMTSERMTRPACC
ncbi:hypothetical protein PLESTM_000834900 [Pleodorina starrii]|nr:hypothetical protein PLESTM_000834900 [Pleodorina starrii]